MAAGAATAVCTIPAGGTALCCKPWVGSIVQTSSSLMCARLGASCLGQQSIIADTPRASQWGRLELSFVTLVMCASLSIEFVSTACWQFL